MPGFRYSNRVITPLRFWVQQPDGWCALFDPTERLLEQDTCLQAFARNVAFALRCRCRKPHVHTFFRTACHMEPSLEKTNKQKPQTH